MSGSTTIDYNGDTPSFENIGRKPFDLPVAALWALGLFIVASVGTFAIAPSLLRLGFPAMSLLCAAVLYRTAPAAYLSFTWWLFFLTPFVRRIVDFRAGFDEGSFLMAAPLLACIVCCLELKHLRRSSLLAFPFLLPSATALFGLLISPILGCPVPRMIQYLLLWLTPIAFGYTIYLAREHYRQLRDVLLGNLTVALCLMGIYGVAQFVLAPGWDTDWMKNATEEGVQFYGVPEPFGIRVFSTMNSHQPFAMVAGTCMLLLLASRRWRAAALLAFAAAFPALLFTSARSAWTCLVAGLIVFALLSRSQRTFRQIALLVLPLALVFGALLVSPYGYVVQDRMESFGSGNSDASATERQAGYADVIQRSLSNPLGVGWVVEPVTYVSIGTFGLHDSTLTELLITTGWVGATGFYSGFLLALGLVIRRAIKTRARDACVYGGALSSLLVASVFNSLVGGVTQVLLFTVIGLSMCELAAES